MTTIKNFDRNDLIEAIDPSIFSLILFPTEQCNFRCVYCYEDFELPKMKPWIVAAIKDLIKTRAEQIDVLNLSWFGGEPLMAKSVIYEISEYAMSIAQEKNIAISGSMTTNAYTLDIETLSRLVASNQSRFQVSIDGDAETHNKTRVKANGGPTFDRIWHNLVEASKTDLNFQFLLRLHVTDENISSIERVADKIQKNFGEDKRFSVYFKEISNLGGNNKDRFSHLIENAKDNREHAKDLNIKIADEQATGFKSDTNYICYAAQPNTLAIRSDGTLNKCTVALDNPANQVGQIKKDGSLDINTELFKLWSEGFADLDKQKLHCPVANVSKKFKYPSTIEVKQVS